MTRRRITITLTDAQYHALIDAWAYRDAEDEGNADADRGRGRARENAFSKIRDAWNGRAR